MIKKFMYRLNPESNVPTLVNIPTNIIGTIRNKFGVLNCLDDGTFWLSKYHKPNVGNKSVPCILRANGENIDETNVLLEFGFIYF